MDTMTATKVLGAVCGSLLILLLGKWAGEIIYDMTPAGGSHGEVAQAYVIDTGASEEVAADAPAEDFSVVLASADPAAGEKVFGKCKACHKLDGTDGTGPHLNGVVNREKAASAGYAYSDMLMSMKPDTWTPENLNAFLANPKTYAPGTKMVFAGLPKIEDRADLVAYLETTQ